VGATFTLLAVLVGGSSRPAKAADAAGPDPKEVKAVLDKAVAFLKTRQNDNGSFSPKLGGPGITALVAAGLVRDGYSPDDPIVSKALG
jgi:squalene-hopene/tetraprenyl-beta-curcumene cyclase